MMRWPTFNILLIALLNLSVSCERQQKKPPEEVTQGADVPTPQHAEPVFDNDYVRAVRFTLEPGDKLPLHQGARRTIYSLSDYKIKWMEGERQTEEEWKKGQVHWHDAAQHAAENIGNTKAEYLVVARKDAVLPLLEGDEISHTISELDVAYSSVVFENEDVRVMEVKIPRGEKQPMHSGGHRLIYALTAYDAKYSSDKTGTKESAVQAGTAHWHGPDRHAMENTGETSADFLIFEFMK